MYFSCKCNVSKILALVVILKFEMKYSLCMLACMYVCYLKQGACALLALVVILKFEMKYSLCMLACMYVCYL